MQRAKRSTTALKREREKKKQSLKSSKGLSGRICCLKAFHVRKKKNLSLEV